METRNIGLIALGALIFILGVAFAEFSAQFLGGIIVIVGFSRKGEKKKFELPIEETPDALKDAEQENMTRKELDAINKPEAENPEGD